MWHGGGFAGVTRETKPDGKPGWQNYFLAPGHDVYVSDAVERGRASWARYPEVFKTEPFFRTKKEAWELFRIGTKDSYNTDPAKRATHKEGSQFPVDAFDQFAKQGIPRWASTTPRCCNRDRPLRCSERGSQAVRPEKTHEQGLRSRCPCIFLPDINRP